MVMRMLRTQIKWIMLSVAVVFVLSLLFMYGPMGGRDEGASRDYAVATADGKKIMRSTLEEGLQEAVERSENREVTSADLPLLRKSVLENIVLTMELEKEAKARGVKIDEGEIDKVLDDIKEQFPTIEAFNQYLTRMGIEMKALRENIALQLAQQKVLEGELASVLVGEGEVQEFYDKTKEVFFRRPEGFNLNIAHVRKAESAAEIASRIRDDGGWDAGLALLSADVADHTPYEEPFFVAAEALQGPFAEIRAAGVDSLVGPIAVASDDFVLVFKREALAGRILPLEEVSGDISSLLLSQRRSEAQQTFFKGLLERARLTIHDEALFAVPEKPREPEAEEAAGVSSVDEPASEVSVSEDIPSEGESDKTE